MNSALMHNLVHSKSELLAALDVIQNQRIVVAGDLILDRYVWGSVERISQEAPVPVLDVRRKEDRLGGAANVARNLAVLGLQVDLCGIIGNDTDAQSLLSLCKEGSIDVSGVLVDPERPTSVKTRIMAGRQQVVRIDSEKRNRMQGAFEQTFVESLSNKIKNTQGLVVSDYGKGVITDRLTTFLEKAQNEGDLSLTKSPFVLDPHPSNYALYRAVGVIKPNRKEAEQAAQTEIHSINDATAAAQIIAQRWQAALVIITLGEDGMLLYDVNSQFSTHFPTLAQDVFDVSGAGDTVTSVLAAGLGAGLSPALACELANIAARIAVSQVGTVAVARDRVREEILHIF